MHEAPADFYFMNPAISIDRAHIILRLSSMFLAISMDMKAATSLVLSSYACSGQLPGLHARPKSPHRHVPYVSQPR